MNDDYDYLFDYYGRQMNVDPRIPKTMFHLESSGGKNTGKALPNDPDSPEGPLQIRPSTGRGLGISDVTDINQAIYGATRYAREGLDQTGSPLGAFAYYHGGPDQNQWGPKTATYVQKAQAMLPTVRIALPTQAAAAAADDIDQELMKGPPIPPAAPQNTADIDTELMGQNSGPAALPKPGEIDPVTGRPAQFLSSASGPVAESLNKSISENQKPSLGVQAIGNLATDPEQRRRIMASQLFPDLSPLEAQSRVFYGDGGRLAAVGQNGQPYYIDPIAPSISGRTIGNPLTWAATGAGAALPMAGGLAGGLAGGNGSILLAPVLAAAGAAGGDLARQGAARYFDPSTKPPPINWGQTGREALTSGVGALIGGVATNALSPNALRVTPGEVNVMRAAPVMADTRAAYNRAAAQGVDLTPGQATGLPSLLQYEDAATTMPGTVDQATGYYRRQGQQIAQAGENMLARISPNADKTDAALMFQQGAEDATRAVRQQANALARPSYQAAERAGNVMSPDLAQLADVPVVQTAMERAARTYQNLYRREAPETPDFALWDLTKRQLDDAHTVAQRAGERTDAMAIDRARQDLVTHLDAAFPTYGQARAIAAPGQRLASQLEESGVGSTASSGVDERARAIVAPVFNQNPRAITQARDAFDVAGRMDEWNAGVRSYIQDAFDKASMSQQGLNPAMLRRQVWGNIDNRDSIRAALTDRQFEGFDNFLRTVEDTARTYPMNSLTATRQNARGALMGAGENQANVRALDAASTVLSPFRWGDMGARLLSGARQSAVQGNVQRIVGHLFSPDGMQYLEAMSRYSPGSQRAIEATAQLMTRYAPNLLGAPAANDTNPLSALSAAPGR